MEDPNLTDSGNTGGAEEGVLIPDPSSQTASGGGVGVAGGDGGGDGDVGSGSSNDLEFGFQRAEFGKEQLAGTVQIYNRHVFLRYNNPQMWSSNVEFDHLPRLLSDAIAARKGVMKRKMFLPKHLLSFHTHTSNRFWHLTMAVLGVFHPRENGSGVEFGFKRKGFKKERLAGTVHIYDRHVFLCYKTPHLWPSCIEASKFDHLPRLLSAALTARKGDMGRRTRLTVCEAEDTTESSNGDVLIFPDMIRYRQLTDSDVDHFVEEALVKDTDWLPGAAEGLKGSYIFVCCHGSRDRRCGICGPAIIEKFKEEIEACGLQDQVFVSPCSHIGGHKYAGNVIIFSSNHDGKVTGHWYGYVSPDDVPILLEQHIGKGEIIAHLWRGQMGLTEEEQKNAHGLRLQLNEKDGVINGNTSRAAGCCQGVGNTGCCQSIPHKEKLQNKNTVEGNTQNSNENKAAKTCATPTWFKSWEWEDKYTALAVVTAAASIVVAYGCYKQLKS